MHEDALSPTSADERAIQLDVLRGFALVGILLMNIEGFVGPLDVTASGLDPTLRGADAVVDGLIYLLVQGKFFTLFSLLFGAGFALILQRAEARGQAAGGLYLRRLLVLAGFGAVHGYYVWAGDILLTYAILGVPLLLLFRRTPASRAPTWGLFFYLLPTLFSLLMLAVVTVARLDPLTDAAFADAMQSAGDELADDILAQRLAYGPEGDFASANRQRAIDMAAGFSYLPDFGPMVLGMFLIGVGLLRSGALTQPDQHLALFRRMRRWGYTLGLPLVLGAFLMVPSYEYGMFDARSTLAVELMRLGNLALCLAYLATVVLALRDPRWAKRLRWLAPAGQMALTNYLMQSLVCVAVFYGYGLAYFEQLPRAWQPLFVFALFGLQVALSHWWLARFRFGPAEWLWRALTYLQLPPMRR